MKFLYQSRNRQRSPISDATVAGYRSYLNGHLNPVLGDMPLSMVDNDALKLLVENLRAKGLKPKTIVSIVDLAKLVVASLQVKGEQVHHRTWNNDYIDLPVVDADEQNAEAFTPEEIDKTLDAAYKTEKPSYYMLALIVTVTAIRIGEGLAIKVGEGAGCPHCKAHKPRKCSHGTVFSPDCRILHVRQSAYGKKLKPPKTKNGIRDIDIPESLAAILREYIANKPSGLLFRSSRDGGPLLQRNINRDFLHPVLESIGLRNAEHWIEDGVRRVKCLDGDGKAWHSMKRFRITHLESQGVSESLIKLWAGHGKKGVTEQSYIKIMGRLDVRRKCVEQAGLGFNHVPSVPRGRLENAA